MPMPGSQEMDSLDIAYFLHNYRWVIRLIFIALIIVGAVSVFRIRHWWIPLLTLIAAAAVVSVFNFKMTADHIFTEPSRLTLAGRPDNSLGDSTVVLGIEHDGAAKAYPIRFLTYHHQVRDTIGGKPIIVTYCSVCRTGRVFEPVVSGRQETFRLVGMDHYNAMFEDQGTKSWWRQATGEAVAGPLKGEKLPEVAAAQMTLGQWFGLFPGSLVMQADTVSLMNYDSLARFERGKSKSRLTRSDSLSWQDKSWILGVRAGSTAKAYDWNRLKQERLIHDQIGQVLVVLVLADDNMSFVVFENPDSMRFSLHRDTLFAAGHSYDFYGRCSDTAAMALKRVPAYQEFWHSWRTFQPATEQY